MCVNPRWVSLAADILAGSAGENCKRGRDFRLGRILQRLKLAQAKEVIFAGADEVDMVVDLAAMMQADERYLAIELMQVLKVCRIMKPPVVLKVNY